MQSILINQLGYTPEMTKLAVLRGTFAPEFSVLNAQGDAVLTVPVIHQAAAIWGDEVTLADFSALTVPGMYTLRWGQATSHPFSISQKPYDACLNALVDAFYYQRCGGEVDGRAGVHAHPACHTKLATVWGTEEQVEVSGGWHDAGDYGRYIVPAAKAVADLLLAWQWNAAAFAQPNLTNLLDELRWELDWMLKMQRADGGVYHKVSCAHFCGMVMPHEETDKLYITPVSTTATGDFAACIAMASRVFRPMDAAYANRLLAAAQKAYGFLQASEPMLFTNPDGITTGGYGDRSDADERLWAAVELAVTCGGPYMAEAVRGIAAADRTRAPLGWGDMQGYAALSGTLLPGEAGDLCRQWVVDAAEGLLSRLNAYGIGMTDRLPWGSNMSIANHGMLFCKAHQLTGEERFLQAAERQLHYLLGVNPVDYCYVSCFGSNPMLHPHHRPSEATGVCVPGLLSGGAASGLNDAVAQEKLQGQPAGKCFVDDAASYSTNEICIYWNSPMVALLAGIRR